MAINGDDMSSLFNQDWNNDGEVDEFDSAIDMMLIEDMENQPNTSYKSSKDKANDGVKILFIIAIGFILICAPIITIVYPFYMGIESIKDISYVFCAIITLIELIFLIKYIIKKVSENSVKINGVNINELSEYKNQVEPIINRIPKCKSQCEKCGCGFDIETKYILDKRIDRTVKCPNCQEKLDYSHIDIYEFKRELKCLGYISSEPPHNFNNTQ